MGLSSSYIQTLNINKSNKSNKSDQTNVLSIRNKVGRREAAVPGNKLGSRSCNSKCRRWLRSPSTRQKINTPGRPQILVLWRQKSSEGERKLIKAIQPFCTWCTFNLQERLPSGAVLLFHFWIATELLRRCILSVAGISSMCLNLKYQRWGLCHPMIKMIVWGS